MIIPVHELLVHVYFKEVRNGFFIECGASDGLNESCCQYLESIGWTGINIEATPEIFARLQKNRPKSRNLNYALCDKSGEIEFNITSHPGNSSLAYSEDHIKELNSYGATFVKVKVPAISYADLIQQQAISKIDLFCLDVEGAETMVLRSMKASPILAKVLCIEAGYDWEDRKKLVLELGYKIDFYHFNNIFCSMPGTVFNQELAQKCNWKEFIWRDKKIY